jgi:hypothetical protein
VGQGGAGGCERGTYPEPSITTRSLSVDVGCVL